MRILIGGAGCAGLMAARELTRAGHEVLILEARDRIGGRILPLASESFGYPAEGGAEFVHGAAPVTHALAKEAGLALIPVEGEAWQSDNGILKRRAWSVPDEEILSQKLMAVTNDLPVQDFLDREFPAPRFDGLRRQILRMTEGYEAADPKRFSTLALRDFWTSEDEGQARPADGYHALLAFLSSGLDIRFNTEIAGLSDRGVTCADGSRYEADAIILTLPPPILRTLNLPLEIDAALAKLGFGDVIKFLFRFETRFWPDNLSFLFCEAPVPTWWSQTPRDTASLSGWVAGPRAATIGPQDEAGLIALGLESLRMALEIKSALIAARVFHWGQDRFSRGAYSYATPETKAAQDILSKPIGKGLFLAGEALFQDGELGTVEAALANGRSVAHRSLEWLKSSI